MIRFTTLNPVFIAIFLSVSVSAQVIFPEATSINAPDTPYELAKGDFNNDGKPDLITANFTDDVNQQLTLLLSNTTGTFSGANFKNVGASTYLIDVAVGDFNEDGNLDAVGCSDQNNNFSLLLGNGAGNFAAAVNFAAGDRPRGIAVGDLNKDSNLDVIVSHIGTPNDVYIFFGNGAGGFSIPTTMAMALNAGYDIAIADFDGDTNNDFAIVVPVSGTSNIQIWTGNGQVTPTFTLDATIASFYNATDMDARDLDGDGDMDILASPGFSLNDGTGTFAPRVLLPSSQEEFAAGDLNGDGHPDIAAVDFSGSIHPNVNIFMGDGAGTFTQVARFEVFCAVRGLEILDINNDGNSDVVGVGSLSGQGKVDILLGDGTGYFSNSVIKYPVAADPRDMVKGDFNEDGLVDVAVCHAIATNNISVFLGLGQGRFSKSPTNYMAGAFPFQILTFDYNKDNHLDLVTFNQSGSSTVTILTGSGNGQFTTLPNMSVATTSGRMASADFNNDTYPDIVVTGGTARMIYLFTGTGTGFSQFAIPVTEDIFEIKAADFNADGNQDLVATFNNVSKLVLFAGNGSGSFTEGTQHTIGSNYLQIHDLNNDGKPDINAFDVSSGGNDFFINDGTGVFTGSTLSVALGGNAFSWADMNGDGLKDLVLGTQASNSSQPGTINIYRGNAAGPSTSQLISKTFSGGFGLVTHDVDADGKEDVIALSNNTYEDYLSVLLNKTPAPCVAPSVSSISPSVAVCPGTTVTFSVTPAGTSPFSYQWRKNSTPIGGATSASYFISSVVSTDAASYTVQITNACGSVTSNAVSLTINSLPPPVPTGASRCGGGVLTLTATGTINGNFRWYDVASGGTPLPGEVNSSYTTPFLSASTSYYVAINNGSCESSRVAVNATINAAPVFNSISPTTIACAGMPATLTVSASGGGTLSYQWKKNTVAIPGASAASLSFASAVLSDAATYAVEISNACGSVTSSDVILTINATPASPVATNASRCSAGTLTLSATGSTDGNYRWYDVSTGGSPLSGEVNGTFNTPSLSVTTLYYVSITDNVCESSRTTFTATIHSLPSKPIVASSIPPASGAVTLCGNGDNVILSGPAGFSSYAWSDGAGVQQQVTIFGAGVYSVQVIDGNDCMSVPSDAITVIVDPAICNAAPLISPPPIIAQAGEIIIINLADYLSDADNNLDMSTLKIIASPISGATAVLDTDFTLSLNYAGISFLGTDNMTIEVCDLLGSCTQAQLAIEVISEGIVVYNGLSPNGDGLNESFHIHDIELLEETRNNHVTIFNRWGDLVFDVANYDNITRVFKGVTNGGNELPSGTYFYKVEFTSGQPSKMGYLVLKK